MNANFDIDVALAKIEETVAPYPKAAMFDLRDQGFGSLFEQLIACVISIRTYDEVSLPLSINLLSAANTPKTMLELGREKINAIIGKSSFSERKTEQILAICQRILDEFGGELPADFDTLTSFNGIGPKCANLALGVSGEAEVISVDIHVHRVTNRWGYVETTKPEKTLKALEEKLPHRHWVDINRLLVPFGKHVCRGKRPKCSTCPISDICEQIGVESAP